MSVEQIITIMDDDGDAVTFETDLELPSERLFVSRRLDDGQKQFLLVLSRPDAEALHEWLTSWLFGLAGDEE